MLPFEVTYGRPPPHLILDILVVTTDKDASDFLVQWNDILSRLKIRLQRAMKIMKKEANKLKCSISFKVGNQILMKLHKNW